MVRNSIKPSVPELVASDSKIPTWEVDGSVVIGIDLVDHVLELRLRWVLAKGAHDSAQLLGGDLSCT